MLIVAKSGILGLFGLAYEIVFGIGTTLDVVFGAADNVVVPVTELLPNEFSVAPVKFIFLGISCPLLKLLS